MALQVIRNSARALVKTIGIRALEAWCPSAPTVLLYSAMVAFPWQVIWHHFICIALSNASSAYWTLLRLTGLASYPLTSIHYLMQWITISCPLSATYVSDFILGLSIFAKSKHGMG